MGIGALMKQKAIFLDRDGVLNHAIIKQGKPYPPASLRELVIPHDVKSSLLLLKKRGFLLIGATNQPDVARGSTQKETVEAINQQLMNILPLTDIKTCFHDDNDGCACRKPSPGLLWQAAEEYSIDLTQSIMIGDRWKDIEAGINAGCKTIWINYHYQEKKPEHADFVANNMTEATHWIQNNYGENK